MIYFLFDDILKLNCHAYEDAWEATNPDITNPLATRRETYVFSKIKMINFDQYKTINFTKQDSIFYVIEIRDTYRSFHMPLNIFDYIESDILQELQTGKIQILILAGCEQHDVFKFEDYEIAKNGKYKISDYSVYKHTILGIMSENLKQKNIDEKYFHYASPDLNTKNSFIQLEKFNIKNNIQFYFNDHYLLQYSHLADTYDPKINLKTQKLYSCLNYGLIKAHRVKTVYELWKQNLLQYGNVSLKNTDHSNYLTEFKNILPLKLDGKENHHWYDFSKIIDTEREILDQTLVYISCETHFLIDNAYITEKTWRAILHKKPFMIIGDSGALAKLRLLGFKTFNNWWNEDYDTWDSDDKKIKYVTWMIKKLSEKTPEEREVWFNSRGDIEGILEHNHKILKNGQWLTKFLTNLDMSYHSSLAKNFVTY